MQCEHLQFPLFAPIITSMLSQRIGFLQYQPSLSKVQPLFSVAAYFQKVVDTHSFVGIITQQLRRKVCLRSDKRAAFSFRQQHHYFSSIFADGTSGVSVFKFTHRRYFAALGIFCALDMQKRLHYKHIINTVFYRRSRPAVWFDSG